MENMTTIKPVRVNVMLCPESWKELRRRGIDQGKSGSELLRDLVSEALRGSTDQKRRRQRSIAS